MLQHLLLRNEQVFSVLNMDRDFKKHLKFQPLQKTSHFKNKSSGNISRNNSSLFKESAKPRSDALEIFLVKSEIFPAQTDKMFKHS
jgi:hypothetical protein